MPRFHEEEIREVLRKSWSIHSSTKWTPANPAKGQCGVTALVIHDLFGGEIRKTRLSEGWHYYNEISGKRMDFTDSQFAEAIGYDDIPSSREEAFMDTNGEQYQYLQQAVQRYFHQS